MPMRAIPYSELIARNLRAARAAAKLTQDDVAERMNALGFTWWAQTVSRVENNHREVTVAEILGLAVALETGITGLMHPAADWQHVTLPDGFEVVLPASWTAYQPSETWKRNQLR